MILSCMVQCHLPDEERDDVPLLHEPQFPSGRETRVVLHPAKLGKGIPGDGAGDEDVLAQDHRHCWLGPDDEPWPRATHRLWNRATE